MDADDEPDPGGWPIDPAAGFYGLWPRYAADDAEDAAGTPAAGAGPEA